IIPTFQTPQMLDSTLGCLTKQKISADLYEIVIINLGNEIETENVVRKYKSFFRNITYLTHSMRKKTLALNKGAEVASGNLLIFLDCGTLVDSNFILSHIASHGIPGNQVTLGLCHSMMMFDYSMFTTDLIQNNFDFIKDIPAENDKRNFFSKTIISNLEKSACNWTYFRSDNFSVKKYFFSNLKGFKAEYDEGWFGANVEFGIRLHLENAKFNFSKDICGYRIPINRELLSEFN